MKFKELIFIRILRNLQGKFSRESITFRSLSITEVSYVEYKKLANSSRPSDFIVGTAVTFIFLVSYHNHNRPFIRVRVLDVVHSHYTAMQRLVCYASNRNPRSCQEISDAVNLQHALIDAIFKNFFSLKATDS